MCRLGAHIVCFRNEAKADFPLHAKTPLLDIGSRIVWIDSSYTHLRNANLGGIEIRRRWKTISEQEHGGGVIRGCDNNVQKVWIIQCKLVLTSVSFEEAIEDSVSATEYCF